MQQAVSFEFVDRVAGHFVFAARAGSMRGLKFQQLEAEVTEWMLDVSGQTDIEVGNGTVPVLEETKSAHRCDGVLYISMRNLADVVSFEQVFGETGLTPEIALA